MGRVVLRLIGFVSMAAIGLSGFLVIDYSMARTAAEARNEDAPSVEAYLGGLSSRIASLGASASGSGLPTELADMLPKAPEGWTVRPTEAADVDGFQPRSGSDGDPKARALIASVTDAGAASGGEAVVLTYEKGEQRVVIRAVRYPDEIFADSSYLVQRQQLQSAGATFRGLSALTVRGLDVTEDWLPDGMRGRVLLADVGGQIHLQMVVPKRMKDADLLPFFETLNVEAMNASVVDRQDGLGQVPVIVLASALGEADRAVYDADRSARKAATAAHRAKALQAEEARLASLSADDAPAVGETKPAAAANCAAGSGGIKRCTVGD